METEEEMSITGTGAITHQPVHRIGRQPLTGLQLDQPLHRQGHQRLTGLQRETLHRQGNRLHRVNPRQIIFLVQVLPATILALQVLLMEVEVAAAVVLEAEAAAAECVAAAEEDNRFFK